VIATGSEIPAHAGKMTQSRGIRSMHLQEQIILLVYPYSFRKRFDPNMKEKLLGSTG
jgi:hypothetical protein